MIEFLLIILTDMPKNFIHHDKIFDLLACVGEEVLFLVRNLEDKSRNEESNNETNCAILDLLEHIELLKGDRKYIYPKDQGPSELRFHMIDRSLFLNLLLSNLNDLLSSNAYSVALINKEIGQLKEDLEFIRVLFGNSEQELHEDLWKRSLNLAYEINYAINSILARDNGLLHLVFSLPNAIEKIKFIKEEVSSLPEKIPKNRGLIIVNSPKMPVENKSSPARKIIVGLKEETDLIIRKLTKGPAELDVISIIGMPGLGKTTLVYKVYNDRLVIGHFDIRAWCTVDQEYNRKMILQNIVNQVTGLDETFKEDTDVDDVLRKKLCGRRCLVVLDDLWDTATWDDLTRPFHQIEKGSRIILTSRKKEVALHGKRLSDPLNLQLLTPEESWELLEKRVFGEESCPVELLDVEKDIAQNCKGLPLVVDLVAEGKRKRVCGLNFKTILSYDHLLDNLKLCFLYLGSYQKDKEIEVNELKALWSAEGFVEEIEMKSVEEVMDEYLDHLVSSSLVMVSKGKFGKNVCQIHELVHDFCGIKAGKEKLLDLITSSSPYFPSSDLMPRQVGIHYDEHLPQSCKDIILFNSKKERDSSCKHLLSLTITGDWEGNLIYHLRHLRLLRALNVDTHLITVTDYLPNEIGMLVHLRYLKIRTENIGALPSSFSILWNLETLVVNNGGCPMELEPVIWNLAKLRYVAIKPCHFSHLGTDEPTVLRVDSKLENLKILETLQIFGSKGQQNILKRLPNLQKLDGEIVKDYSAGCNWFPQFGFLLELEELKLFDVDSIVSFEARDRSDFPLLPPSIKFLELNCASLTSDSLSTITRLPNLQKLHLRNLDILEGEWNMQEDDTFENLKILEVYWGFFSKWHVREESFPVLEHLILRFFVQFKEILI